MSYDVHVIHEGYSRMEDDSTMAANCSCTVLKGQYNIIVDTMTPWDKDIIIEGLKKLSLKCEDIHYVICTHGHSDHVGNNNLFLNTKQLVVGYAVSHRDRYILHDFDSGQKYKIDENIEILPTPGHTGEDITVIVKSKKYGIVAVAGDLFEKEEDLKDSTIWRVTAGSQLPEKQEINRNKILAVADYIVPGHGPMFKVPEHYKR